MIHSFNTRFNKNGLNNVLGFKRKDKIFGIDDAFLISAGISAGSGLLGNLMNSGADNNPSVETSRIVQLPDYKESAGARSTWYNKLMEWMNQPGYGAISPDWDSIWQKAMDKVNTYYQGSSMGPGVYDQVRASAARRGVSDSPALDFSLARAKVAQGKDITGLAQEESIQKNQFAEQGRQNWLSSLQNLAGIKPSYATIGLQPDANQEDWGSVISTAGQGLASGIMQNQQQDWLGNLYKEYGSANRQNGMIVAPDNYYLNN